MDETTPTINLPSPPPAPAPEAQEQEEEGELLGALAADDTEYDGFSGFDAYEEEEEYEDDEYEEDAPPAGGPLRVFIGNPGIRDIQERRRIPDGVSGRVWDASALASTRFDDDIDLYEPEAEHTDPAIEALRMPVLRELEPEDEPDGTEEPEMPGLTASLRLPLTRSIDDGVPGMGLPTLAADEDNDDEAFTRVDLTGLPEVADAPEPRALGAYGGARRVGLFGDDDEDDDDDDDAPLPAGDIGGGFVWDEGDEVESGPPPRRAPPAAKLPDAVEVGAGIAAKSRLPQRTRPATPMPSFKPSQPASRIPLLVWVAGAALLLTLAGLGVYQFRNAPPPPNARISDQITVGSVAPPDLPAPDSPDAQPRVENEDGEPIDPTEQRLDQLDTFGRLQIDASRRATIYLNGKRIGTTPLEALELEQGTYRVRAVAVGLGRSKEIKARVDAGTISKIAFSFD